MAVSTITKITKPCAKLVRAVNFWRSELRLDDWELTVAMPTPEQREEMARREQTAFVAFSAPHRTASIVLRSITEFDKDLEEDLVHELLHLVFVQYSLWASQGREQLDDLDLEQGLNALATCLVKLRNERER